MKDLPVRKKIRLTGYDYSQANAYFITICIEDRHEILGNVVGDGVLDVPTVQLSKYGAVVEKRIKEISENYNHIQIQKYVIMPNHVHILMLVLNNENGTSRTPSPTNAVIPSFVSTFKRFVHKDCGFSLFQRSYHDHIIRNENEYHKIWQYIDTNPMKWQDDYYFVP
ncbi:MAG: transposase [Oscillospiraceae bacterium]|nr:transposase [Oscillospiraceae bacterium]